MHVFRFFSMRFIYHFIFGVFSKWLILIVLLVMIFNWNIIMGRLVFYFCLVGAIWPPCSFFKLPKNRMPFLCDCLCRKTTLGPLAEYTVSHSAIQGIDLLPQQMFLRMLLLSGNNISPPHLVFHGGYSSGCHLIH